MIKELEKLIAIEQTRVDTAKREIAEIIKLQQIEQERNDIDNARNQLKAQELEQAAERQRDEKIHIAQIERLMERVDNFMVLFQRAQEEHKIIILHLTAMPTILEILKIVGARVIGQEEVDNLVSALELALSRETNLTIPVGTNLSARNNLTTRDITGGNKS
ncbi:MAG TPA: hypothetical protein VFW58_08570 [Trichococcus sp.]|nr:hypothetical protein [Trichococcus sp.]